MTRITALFLFLCLGLITGCSSTGSAMADSAGGGPRIGAACHVQLKRDLLGASGSLPISPTTDTHNGADVSVRGKLLQFDAKWVVVRDASDRTLWIPMQNVLLVQMDAPENRDVGTSAAGATTPLSGTYVGPFPRSFAQPR